MRENSGFTLIELILVTVIIGILAGAVTMTFQGRTEQTRVARARSDIVAYQDAVELYAIDNNDDYPKKLSDLMGGKRNYLRKLQKDPWNRDYVYTVPGKSGRPYDISSLGKDGAAGTSDDVTSWSDPPVEQ